MITVKIRIKKMSSAFQAPIFPSNQHKQDRRSTLKEGYKLNYVMIYNQLMVYSTVLSKTSHDEDDEDSYTSSFSDRNTEARHK